MDELKYNISATEPLYDIVHIWTDFSVIKAEEMALDLFTKKWRNIKIKEAAKNDVKSIM